MVRDPKTIDMLTRDYPYGFVTEIEEDSVPAGLSEHIIRAISSKKNEVSTIINGFCKQALQELPMEFAVEARKLLGVSLEGSVG